MLTLNSCKSLIYLMEESHFACLNLETFYWIGKSFTSGGDILYITTDLNSKMCYM